MKKPLKRSKLGLELELMTIDTEGYVINAAQQLIRSVKSKYPEVDIVKEVGQHMIEVHSFPSEKAANVAFHLLTNLERISEIAIKKGIRLFTLGTYPGKFTGMIHPNKRYALLSEVIGRRLFQSTAPYVNGFHFHYTLPRGIFDFNSKFLRMMVKSKIKQSLIDSYNMLIAADPALTTLLQSSPFVHGRYLAKDSRMLVYRGGQNLNYTGRFSKSQILGSLPSYKSTLSDLIHSLHVKDKKWKTMLEKKGHKKEIAKKHILDYAWNPVKINQKGTLEQRGMDSNHPKYIIAVSVFLKYILECIQQQFYRAIPSDIGIDEPFKVEGSIIHIPPHSYVRNKLQHLSAYNGLDSDIVFYYCKKFINFSRKLIPRKHLPTIKPILRILERRKTTSDILLLRAKKSGYSIHEPLPNDFCAELSVKSSDQLIREIETTKRNIMDVI